MKIRLYNNGYSGTKLWLEGKRWRFHFPNFHDKFFYFEKKKKNGLNGEGMVYQFGFIERTWVDKSKWWFLKKYKMFIGFPFDDFSPQCG